MLPAFANFALDNRSGAGYGRPQPATAERIVRGYVIFLDLDLTFGGSNVVSALAGPGALTGLNGTILDYGFSPTHAVTVNNRDGTTYVDLTDLTTGVNTYLGRSQMDSRSGTLTGGTNPNGALGGAAAGSNPGITGAAGANNLGSLVRAWGQVTDVNSVSGAFYVDDRSGLQDGSIDSMSGLPIKGIRVFPAPGGVTAGRR